MIQQLLLLHELWEYDPLIRDDPLDRDYPLVRDDALMISDAPAPATAFATSLRGLALRSRTNCPHMLGNGASGGALE